MSRFALVAALTLALGGVALAQELPVDPEQERQAEYLQRFSDGIAAINRRDLAASEKLFLRCVELFPDRHVSYYNLACTYSLGERVDDAVRMLRESFARGFYDLAHMGRDMDLDPIRRTPQFRAAMSEFEETLLRQCGPARTHAPAEGGVDGVLVWVHDQRADAARDLARLQAVLPTWAILVPEGVSLRGGQGQAWDERVEFVVLERLRAFTDELGARLPADARRLIAGEGAAGFRAVSIAVHHPDVFAGVLACGPALDAGLDEELAPSGTRAYLVVHRDDPQQVESAVEARNRFVRARSPVVLERYALPQALSQDRAVLLRGLSWLSGNAVQLPGAGVEHTF